MGYCELCGKNKKTRTVKEEGAIIEACYDCCKEQTKNVTLKTIQSFNQPRINTAEMKKYSYELIENYGNLIKQKRGNKTIEEFAKQLNISTNYLKKIENEQLTPDKKTIQILEKQLNIKLTERIEEPDEVEQTETQNSEFTLGDILKNKLKLK
jgi:uncharacterized protein (TIGR00270 family)